MRRNINPDYKFKKENFRDVLQRAIGVRSFSSFAKEANLSFGYVSKYMNLKADSAPTLTTIRKMAKVSEGANYEELLIAAGYDVEKIVRESSNRNGKTKGERTDLLRNLFEILITMPFPWKLSNIDMNGGPLFIEVINAPFELWYFIPIGTESISKEKLVALLNSEKATGIKANSKLSFLTSSNQVYEQLIDMELKLFSLHISAVYMNPDDGEIEKEEYVRTAIELSDDEKMYYVMSNKKKKKTMFLSMS